MRLLSVLAVLLLLSPVLFAMGSAAESGEPEEIIGDWIITENTTVKDRQIILQGNLKILSGGLEMINSTIMFRCYADGQFGMVVSGGTELKMYESVLKNAPGYHRYYIHAARGSRVFIESSSVMMAGFGPEEDAGLYVEGFFSIHNSSFIGNYAGLWAVGGRDGVIENTSFFTQTRGIVLERCRNTALRSSSFIKMYNESVLLRGGYNNSIVACEFEGAYGVNGRAIHAINESLLLIEGSSVNATAREGVLIEGMSAYHNVIRGNSFGFCGISQVSVVRSSGHIIEDNVMEGAYKAISLRHCSNMTVEDSTISDVTIGIDMDHCEAFVSRVSLSDIERYALLFDSSRVILRSVSWKNVSYIGVFQDSLVFSNYGMDTVKYLVKGNSSIYFFRQVSVKVLSKDGDLMEGVEVSLYFEGVELFREVTGANGRVSFMAPYLLRTIYGRNYSWCEVHADSRYRFEENPIRFYSWATSEVVFQELAGEFMVIVEATPVEVSPGDVVNITVSVLGDHGPVDGANVTVIVNGTELFPPQELGDGKYMTSFSAPDFNASLRIEVVARLNGSKGTGYTTIMRAQNSTVEPSSPEEEDTPWEYYLLGALPIAVVILFAIKKRRRGSFEEMEALPQDSVDIEER